MPPSIRHWGVNHIQYASTVMTHFQSHPASGNWLSSETHTAWLREQARKLWTFHRASLLPSGLFATLDTDGTPLPDPVQELHATTRMIHSFALGQAGGLTGCDDLIDAGMTILWNHHRDTVHGGYLWAVNGNGVVDDRKLAYGHVFVLLAGASAASVGHPDAARLIADVSEVLDARFWEPQNGRFCDEWARDWTPFSTYRGMNANMHGTEALLAAFEATGEQIYLDRASQILQFFVHQAAPQNGWHIPEHYTETWEVDRAYAGDPMFRPAGTTPGHSFEWARLLLQHLELAGRPDDNSPSIARSLIMQALADGWNTEKGGIVYTLDFDASPAIADRYWWPLTEAIGALAVLIKLSPTEEDEALYRKLWQFAAAHFIDHTHGGWFHEIDAAGAPTATQFHGKPDIYHALQAAVYPMLPGLSRPFAALKATRPFAD